MKSQTRGVSEDLDIFLRSINFKGGSCVHVGLDAESGVVHTAICTHAEEADITVTEQKLA
jgi:hypothetical protein